MVPDDNGVITDPIEAWLYFFRRANEMTTQEIKQRFSSPAFTEAAEVLDMIQRTPQQRDQYELRLKAQRDHRARLQQATADGETRGRAEGFAEGFAKGFAKGFAEGFAKGFAEGKAEGKIIGQIETLASLLKVQVTTLDNLSVEELRSVADDLQSQLRDRDM